MSAVDLRSDTVTLPTPEMREAMANAEVGDDVYGEDPTVNRLERTAAERMGKAASVFVASGTMGNLVAVLAHAQRGDEVILGDQCHTYHYEAGGVAALGGVHPRPLPTDAQGRLEVGDIEAAIRPSDPHYPITRLICLENTHNRRGGSALSAEYIRQVGAVARSHGLALHIDGARIFNAAIALGTPVRELVEPADSVTFCLSKGLGAPVGSLLCGSVEFIARARRVRKQVGGGMRQAGILAAAGLVALGHMVDRLAEDHRRARLLAEGLAETPGFSLDWDPPSTNMVFATIGPPSHATRDELVGLLAAGGVRVLPVGTGRIRMVTHWGVDDAGIQRAVDAIRTIVGGDL